MTRFLIIISLCITLPAMGWAKGVALVIGNSDYANVSALDNPGNDATAVAAALRAQGFEVLLRTDLNRVEMRDTLREFRPIADGADVALVYYAGHGIEIAGVNYLVPVDARLEDERDAGLEMVEVDLILRQISGARQLKMIVLDACRNNPFVVKMRRENSGRNVGTGLGRVQTSEPDTLIAYAAAAGEITPDGPPGGNSPFTRAFLNALQGPPADVRRLLGRARDELRRSVPGAAPFVYTSLGGSEMVINPLVTAPAQPAPAPPETATGSISEDFVRIDRDGTLEDWNAFLVRWESQSDHPLYAFALEKREALKSAAAPRAGQTRPPPDPAPGADTASAPAVAAPARSRDAAARALQEVLRDRGCYGGAIDGILGSGSQRGLAAIGAEIGAGIALRSTASADEIETVLATLAAHPGAACPVTTVRTSPKPAGQSSDAAAPRPQPAAPAPSEPQQADDDQNFGRSDGSKLVPINPSDCIGSRRKFFDCD